MSEANGWVSLASATPPMTRRDYSHQSGVRKHEPQRTFSPPQDHPNPQRQRGNGVLPLAFRHPGNNASKPPRPCNPRRLPKKRNRGRNPSRLLCSLLAPRSSLLTARTLLPSPPSRQKRRLAWTPTPSVLATQIRTNAANLPFLTRNHPPVSRDAKQSASTPPAARIHSND
jgi:hypothetical protein